MSSSDSIRRVYVRQEHVEAEPVYVRVIVDDVEAEPVRTVVKHIEPTPEKQEND